MDLKYRPASSFIRVATATPLVRVADISYNMAQISLLFQQAVKEKVSLVVFPELSITGYTIGDLVASTELLKQAREALQHLALQTTGQNAAMIVGLPFAVQNAIYNCTAFLSDGRIQGIVPKQNLPTYKEFYEKRWYQPGSSDTINIDVGNYAVPFGTPLFTIGEATIGIEICEDLWVANQPSILLAARGATVICNPSASPETVTKSDYRRDLVNGTAARLMVGYVYSGADPSESTMDIVMSGHAIISENGRQIAERKAFDNDAPRLTVADIDIEHLKSDRRRDTNYMTIDSGVIINSNVVPAQKDLRTLPAAKPFIPREDSRLEEIFTIQAFGLKKRMESAGAQKVVLGLSGGLDSTLALLVAVRAAELMKKQPGDLILTLTMPGEASSERTQSNAAKLAASLGIENRIIAINLLAEDQLTAIGHEPGKEDPTYENTQARVRTSLLFNTANQETGIVLGTGDLSEIALGWCTYNGDHMSGYNVNASIPKTLVRHLVRYAAERLSQKVAQRILYDILDTPISPELVKAKGSQKISQKTEDLIGPYVLHDFFLYHFVRWLSSPEKIQFLAEKVFATEYTKAEISHWLEVFLQRFATNQWKRSVMPDGPKVGSVSLSPRGDWRMPSDVSTAFFKQ